MPTYSVRQTQRIVSFTLTHVAEKNNRHLAAHPARSLLGDAKALLENNGSLSEAALLLEAAIQHGELGEGGYEAWILLGETRNMDEREEAGMRALIEGVKKAEEVGSSGAGMLVRGISTLFWLILMHATVPRHFLHKRVL